MPESPHEAILTALANLALFDHADFQKSFVQAAGEHENEASFMLEGITCAVCIWLNERHIGQLSGVTAVSVNYAIRRARVRWDTHKIKLSDILAAIAAIGYRAHPYDAFRYEELNRVEVARESGRDGIVAHMDWLDRQIKELLQTIRAHIDRHPNLKGKRALLNSILGVDEHTIALLLTFCVHPGRFRTYP